MADQAFVVTEDDVRAMLLAGDSIVGQAGRSMQVIDYLEQGNSESPLMLEGAHRSFYYTPGEPLIEKRGSERLKCWECGKRFEWTVEEQDKFRMRGWNPPKRCESCREKRHGQREAWL